MFRGRMHGLARYVYSTVEALSRLRPEWEITLLEREGALRGLAASCPNVETLPVRSDPFTPGEHLELPALVAEHDPAVFHCPTIAVPVRTGRARLVVTVPDLTPLHFPRGRLNRLYFSLVLAPALRRARRVLVFSEHAGADVSRHLGVPRERIRVSPLGVDDTLRRRRDPQEVRRARQAAGVGERYLVCLANPKPHKNLGLLLEAFDGADLDADLLLASAPAPWLVEAVARSRRVVHREHLPEEDLPALLQGALALVIPSLYEGFGLPVAEAMAAGTPVVAAEAASLPEVAGGAALLFPPRDAQALARALQRVCGDEDLRRSLAARGLERSERWTWEETARVHAEAYEEAVRGRG